MNPRTLDLDTLRTLVVANDLGGYGHAAAQLGRTPSAISLQMKRLQDDLGAPLFKKRGRGLALTEAGETVLRYGRRMLALNDELVDAIGGAALAGSVSLGCAQDFADTVLPAVLAELTTLHPAVQLEVRIEGNAALADAVAKGQLDLALTVGQAERPTAQAVGTLELAWIAARHFRPSKGAPLPLLVLGPQCAFRQAATRALDEAGVPWRVAAVSPSLGGLWAAARGGLGVTVRSGLGVAAPLVAGARRFGLPALGAFTVALQRRAQPASAARLAERLATMLSAEVARALPLSAHDATPRSGSSRRATPARASSARRRGA